jgi:hypothetical protein
MVIKETPKTNKLDKVLAAVTREDRDELYRISFIESYNNKREMIVEPLNKITLNKDDAQYLIEFDVLADKFMAGIGVAELNQLPSKVLKGVTFQEKDVAKVFKPIN